MKHTSFSVQCVIWALQHGIVEIYNLFVWILRPWHVNFDGGSSNVLNSCISLQLWRWNRSHTNWIFYAHSVLSIETLCWSYQLGSFWNSKSDTWKYSNNSRWARYSWINLLFVNNTFGTAQCDSIDLFGDVDGDKIWMDSCESTFELLAVFRTSCNYPFCVDSCVYVNGLVLQPRSTESLCEGI